MKYVTNLRGKVGHIPLILVGASVHIFNEEDELLLLFRTDKH